jgi:polar amino acid transport system permease protein
MITELKVPVARQIVAAYIELSRGTPLLVQLFFLYFGFPKLGITLSAETCAIVGLAFLGGSYMSEAFRGGIEAVGPTQTESCRVLGMTWGQTMRHVVIPQALSTALPGVVANVIFLVKESSVVSGIALADLMYLTKDLIGLYYNTTESLLMLVVAYTLILLPISIVGTILERRFDYARR